MTAALSKLLSSPRKMPHRKDLRGRRFGKLVVAKFSRTDRSSAYWVCNCDCGNTKEIRSHHLRSGHAKSCGCSRSELVAAVCKKNAKNKYTDSGWIGGVMSMYRFGAKRRGLTFSLSREDVESLIFSDCYYCGDSPANTFERRLVVLPSEKHQYNGIDRLDNGAGYDPGNCVPCCKFCNLAKNQFTKEEFLSRVRKIAMRWPDNVPVR